MDSSGEQTSEGVLTAWISRLGPQAFSTWAIGSAFGVYFCMYAFRKPFTAGEFEGVVHFGGESEGGLVLPYKTLLVISQVLGYACSKFIGVRLISQTGKDRRAIMIIGCILLAEAALIGFAVTPQPWNAILLFANGLPLGLVFGLVLAYLEGRRLTEALAAGLCASFILSSGVVKSIGQSLVLYGGVSEYWMPALTGALFFAPLCLCVWCLKQLPPPAVDDIKVRSVRKPVTADERWAFFGKHVLGLTLIMAVYIGLTVMRSLRDDFAVEIWKELGETGRPSIFARTEFAVMLTVIALNGAAIWIPGNKTAFFGSLWLLIAGFGLSIASVTLFRYEAISPFLMMVGCGVGLYVPYVAFHTTVFERLIASAKWTGNIGFLMYVADSTGYLGYVGVMLAKSLGRTVEEMLEFFLASTSIICSVCLVLTLLAIAGFRSSLASSDA